MIKVSKELLQRYEDGACSSEEEHFVREWLDSDHWSEEIFEEIPVSVKVKKTLWHHISAELDQGQQEFGQPVLQRKKWSYTHRIINCAAMLILTLGLSWHFYSKNQENLFELNNEKEGVKWIRKDYFDLALLENSSVHINLQSDNLQLSGGMMLKPKRNLILHDLKNEGSFQFKQGEVYFISRDSENSSLTIVRKSELFFLSPIIQRQLKQQFNLS